MKGWRISPEEKMVLWDISWGSYERLLGDHLDKCVPRFAYDRGTLEIFRPSLVDEVANRSIAAIIETVAKELEVASVGLGSTTFKREDLQRGFEPDSCFFMRENAVRMRSRQASEFALSAPPDLIVEVRETDFAPNKLSIFASFGVPEVWRYDGKGFAIFVLGDGEYAETAGSIALPPLTGQILTRFVEESNSLGFPIWIRKVREWARENPG